MTKVIHFGEVKVFCFCDSQYFFAFLVIEELTFFVQQFQSVPLFWVVAGGQDDTTCGVQACYCQLGGWSGCQADINNIITHTNQGTAYQLVHHLATQTGVATYDNSLVVWDHCFTLCSVGCGETYHIHWAQALCNATTDGATNA